MISHITLGSNDLAKGADFYDALLAPLGLVKDMGNEFFYRWAKPDGSFPHLFLVTPFDGKAASAGNGSMVAFSASSKELVIKAYDAGISAGGTCEGPPGDRPEFGKGYYGAYLRDPDGNKVHVVLR